MEEDVASPSTDSGDGVFENKIDQNLENTLTGFIQSNNNNNSKYEQDSTAKKLYILNVQFNCATVNRLTTFLVCSGVVNSSNRASSGQISAAVVNELYIDGCTFETDESLHLFCIFFAFNQSLKTLHTFTLGSLSGGVGVGGGAQQVYESILSSLHNNTTIMELSLMEAATCLQGTTGGKMVGDLLQHNTHLTALCLTQYLVYVDFIHAMRHGLLASRTRLQSLRFFDDIVDLHDDDGNEVLNELRFLYKNNNNDDDDGDERGGQQQQKNTTVLCELDFCSNMIGRGVGGKQLIRLLFTLPCLKKLNISYQQRSFGPDGARSFFSTRNGISTVMSRLQTLCMTHCYIGNVGLAQMAESMPDSVPLVHLDLGYNDIQGLVGSISLACLLRCCKSLEALILSGNHFFSRRSARVLAPALGNLCSLQKLNLSCCDLQYGANVIIANLTTETVHLKSLNLAENDLPSTTLVVLTGYLNGLGRCLEELLLQRNDHLFRTSYLSRFFNTIANHKCIQCLDIRLWVQCLDNSLRSRLNRLTDEEQVQQLDVPLRSTVFKNRSLVTINDEKAEYMRRDMLMTLIQVTMNSPTTISVAVWPMALGVCAPRFHQVGAHPSFCLVQKMAEGDVFVHTAAVYRFEKILSSIRVQRWWRHVVALKVLQHRTRSTASP